MCDFQKEERYIVVKLKDIGEHEQQALREFLCSWHIPTRGGVFVEDHWPENEWVWDMIKSRVETGSPYGWIKDHTKYQCRSCYGSGKVDDADLGDISYNEVTCHVCNGTGVKGVY